MPITVTITKTLEPFWGDEEELATVADAQIISMVREYMDSFVDGATWSVERSDGS